MGRNAEPGGLGKSNAALFISFTNQDPNSRPDFQRTTLSPGDYSTAFGCPVKAAFAPAAEVRLSSDPVTA